MLRSLSRSSGDKELNDWMKALRAVLVINGSYFSRYGTPITPVLSAGVLSGPGTYDAEHGAFVASDSSAEIRDLARDAWKTAFQGATDALVSYPLLLAIDGKSRAKPDPYWLANRSFIAQDAAGELVFGTTMDAFFSLDRLAEFLRTAPLGLKIVLNLDGGHVACQGIALNGYERNFCGDWQTEMQNGTLKLLKRVLGTRRSALPIVISAIPR
jgi:hypothetical protein